MKLTVDNYKNYVEEKDQSLLYALLLDVEELNGLLDDQGLSYKKIYIDYIDAHTEYSPEWTDPCPDYYGMFCIRFERDDSGEMIGGEMTIDDLDNALFVLINFVEFTI